MLLWRCYVVLCFLLFLYAFNSERPVPFELTAVEDIKSALVALEGTCLDSGLQDGKVTFVLCYAQSFSKIVFDDSGYRVLAHNVLGDFRSEESTADMHVFKSSDRSCSRDGASDNHSQAIVQFECCPESAGSGGSHFLFPMAKSENQTSVSGNTFISQLTQVEPCDFRVVVCSTLLCSGGKSKSIDEHTMKQTRAESLLLSIDEQNRLKDRAKDIFYHAYRAYLNNAFPEVGK